MKRIFLPILAAAFVASNSFAAADTRSDFRDAVGVFEYGDYRAAHQLLLPLAQRGYSPAEWYMYQMYMKPDASIAAFRIEDLEIRKKYGYNWLYKSGILHGYPEALYRMATKQPMPIKSVKEYPRDTTTLIREILYLLGAQQGHVDSMLSIYTKLQRRLRTAPDADKIAMVKWCFLGSHFARQTNRAKWGVDCASYGDPGRDLTRFLYDQGLEQARAWRIKSWDELMQTAYYKFVKEFYEPRVINHASQSPELHNYIHADLIDYYYQGAAGCNGNDMSICGQRDTAGRELEARGFCMLGESRADMTWRLCSNNK